MTLRSEPRWPRALSPRRRPLSLTSLCVICSTLNSGALRGAEPSPITNAALKHALALRPTLMGVTRTGVLWGWNASTGDLTLIDRSGGVKNGAPVLNARAVDVEDAFGVAALSQDGRGLRTSTLAGKNDASVALPDQCFGLAWLDEQRLVVTPRFIPYEALLIDRSTGRVLERYGPRRELVPRASGLQFVHSILVRIDRARQMLVTLDAFEGIVSFHALKGGTQTTATLPNPQKSIMQQWLEHQNASALAKGARSQSGVISFPSLSLDDEGDAWVGVDCESPSKAFVLARVKNTGAVDTRTLQGDTCCTVHGIIWGQHFIRHNDPVKAQTECHEVRTP